MNFRFDQPGFLLLLLLAVPIVWLGMRSLTVLDPVRRWVAIGLRLVVLALIVAMLAGLQGVQNHSDLTVIAVVDESRSVREFAKPPSDLTPDDPAPESIEQWVRQYIRLATREREEEDRFGHVRFDGRASVRDLPGKFPKSGADMSSAAIEDPVEGTRSAEALRAALAMFPPDTGARLVLVGDGNDTGSLAEMLAVAREAAAAGIPIDVLPINYRVQNEVMVEGVYAPTEAREGQTVAVRVVLRGTAPTPGLLYLQLDDSIIDLNGEAEGTGMPVMESEWSVTSDEADPDALSDEGPDQQTSTGRFVLAKQIDLLLQLSGANKFKAIFEADTNDAIQVNNSAETFTLVSGRGRILVVDGVGGDSGKILPNALANHGIDLDIVPPRSIPTSLTRMSKYDAIVLQNVSAEFVTGPQRKAMSRYVHDLGGGFIMVGGPDSFGAGAWTNTEIDRSILPVNCTIPSQTILPSGALVIVIDRSGSMGAPVMGTTSSQQEVANEAAILALATLYPEDKVGVVAFDDGAKWISKVEFNNDPAALAKKMRSIHPGGGTDIYSGLKAAYEALAPLDVQDAAVKHVILLTDGASQPPPGGGWAKLVGQMSVADITLSTIGVGDGHNGQLLNQLAHMGGGQYHPVSNPNTLPQVFIKEAKVVRKNLIKEVDPAFTPQLVNDGSPILQGISALPGLKGFVLTGPKNDPRVFMPIVGPEGEPIFAHWQVGLGRSAAFTSDATNRWATQWLGWGGYSDFWARTVRAIARPNQSREVDLITSIRGDALHIRLDAAGFAEDGDAEAAFENFMTVRGAVLTPGADAEPQEIKLAQTGPGVYEATVPAADAGNYIVNLFMQQPDGSRRAVFGGASRPPGGELRKFESNPHILRQIAEMTGGRVLDPMNPVGANLFSRDFNTFESRSIRPLWRSLLWLLLILILLDVANRRVAWEPLAILAAVRKFAASLVLKSPDEEATQTLGALRKKRAAVQAQHAEPAPDAPVIDATRKFVAPEGARAEASFADAVGGAREDGSSRTLVTAAMRKSKAAAESGEPATTSRLLAAKLRAQERLEEQEGGQ